MNKNFALNKIDAGVILITFIMIFPASIVISQVNINNKSLNEMLDDQSAEPIWIYDSDLYIKHVDTADLNGDNVKDVIAAEYDNTYYYESSKIYGIDGTDGDTLWTYSLDDGIRSMTLGDINDDGVMDVVAGAAKGSPTPDGRVHAIDGSDGDSIWIFTPGGTGDTNGDVAIGDFNSDDYPDVAVACWDDYVYAINGQNGNQLWSKYIGGIFVTAVDTGDVNGDGVDDVAFANSYLAGPYDNYQGVLDGSNGSTIWNQTVGYKVENVIMADIDDDNYLEAVFGIENDDDELEIHVRNAIDGTLEWNYTVGTSTANPDAFLFTNDIDEDGDLDLIVGNEYVDFYIYAFDGDSSTLMWTSEQLSGYARDIAFGDVTGNGNKNIIAATYDRVQVLEASNGSKTWYYSVAGTIRSVSNADFDSDGILDVAAGGSADASGSPPNPEKSVWALRTVQSPLLWEFNFGEYGNALAIDDLNGDQFMDVVTVCSLDDKATVINGKNGTELWNWVGTQNLYAVTTGDFNNNGQVDVAVAGADDQVTALYGNNGNVLWQFTSTGDQIYRKCLQATDLNDDGNIDVIVGCDDNYVYGINGLNGNQLWSRNVGADVNEVELAQMDANGPLDIVAAVGLGASGEKVVVINGSNGNILWTYNAPEAVEHVAVFDVNNDTVLDVAAAITPYSPMQMIMIDGSTHSSIWTKSISIASNVHSLAHGDLNGDDIPDVVIPGTSTNKKVYALNGSNGNELWNYQTGGEINSVAVDDIDSDNELDVIAGSDDQNVYVLNRYNGSKKWSYSTADDVMHIQLGDISGDGVPNIACVTFGFDGIAYAFKSFSPAPNLPPNTPSNPSPSDGATYVDPNADLSWDGGDPNPGDTVTYDVYFGTSSPPPKVASNQSDTTYDPGTMGYNTTYYWQIVAWDNHNASAEGSIWEFTIEGPNNAPNTPSNPNPPDGEVDVDINADLSWDGGDPDPGDSVIYDVYFGDTSPPPQVAWGISDTSYDPGTMEYSTKYYWKIVSWDNHGASAFGPLWDFTTGSEPNDPPDLPSNPDPLDGAIDVSIDTNLSWDCSDPNGDEIVYDIYLEADDSTPDILVADDHTETTFDPGTLEFGTIYYWQIIAIDEHSASTIGHIWHFTTEENMPPDAPSIDGPLSGEPGTEYDYIFNSVDPDGDDVKYHVDWGDDTSDETALNPSGTDVTVSHTWAKSGKYTITAYAEDVYGHTGSTSTFQVTMPRDKAVTSNMLLLRILERFPLLQKLIQQQWFGL